MAGTRPEHVRRGAAALALLGFGGAFYLVFRDPVPLVGVSSIGAAPHWFTGSLPSGLYAAALVLGASWAAPGARRLWIATIATIAVTAIEMSQVYGPLAGWGTFDPVDAMFGAAGVGLGVIPIGRPRERPVHRRRTVRMVAIVVAALTAAAASAQQHVQTNFRVEIEEPVVTSVDGETVIVDATAGMSGGEARESALVISASSGDAVTIDPDRCEWFDVDVGGCRFTVTRTGPALGLATVAVSAHATKGSLTPVDDSVSVTVAFAAPPEAEAEVTQAPSCTAVPPAERAFTLGGGPLLDEIVLATYPESSHVFTGRTTTIDAEGVGAHLVGLVMEGHVHDPCTEGPINTLAFVVAATGREGDRGNVAVRPALFISGQVYVAAPFTIAAGQPVSGEVTLVAADFSPIGDAAIDLVSGPEVQFGLVVGVSCPATSTCGVVSRAATIDELQVVINAGAD